MQAILALEDGRVFRGRGYGASGERFGEVVFNTSLSGYQEILTDPSYAGQIVVLTYPHIGNYGTNPLDSESVRPFAEGLVVRELTQLASHWRSVEEPSAFLAGLGVPVVGCSVTVVPAATPASDALELKPDGVFLSNGPGDPEPVEYAAKAVRDLMGRVPIFGICLGHQIIGLALGGRTYKLKFGHHGGNHPVLNLETQKVEITAQNHGFAVDPDSLQSSEVALTHMNLNDQTLEGLRHKSLPLFSVQYHPEASPGPHDAAYLFERFAKMMEECRR